MANEITTAQMAKVQDVFMADNFGKSIKSFLDLIGIARPEVMHAGTQIQQIEVKATGTLTAQASEGAVINPTQYAQTVKATYTVNLKNFRKVTTAQAILKSGYEVAVQKTDDALSRDIRASLRSELVTFLNKATTNATGKGLQEAVANATGELVNILSENGDESEGFVYFVNPKEVYTYLAGAPIQNQGTLFGMQYLQGFMGMDMVFMDAKVPAGTLYVTPRENIHAYTVDFAELNRSSFAYQVDQTGVIGVCHAPSYANATAETYASCGLTIIPEITNYIVKTTITKPTR